MVNSHHISIFQRVLNNIYILFLIVVFLLIGKLLYLTLYQIVRYIRYSPPLTNLATQTEFSQPQKDCSGSSKDAHGL